MANPDQHSKSSPLAVGDRVAYSRGFLRSVGVFAGDMPHARGEIKKLTPLGGRPWPRSNGGTPSCRLGRLAVLSRNLEMGY